MADNSQVVTADVISPAAPAPPALSKRSKALRVAANLVVATICGLAFGFTAQGFIISMLSKQVVGSRDFVVYWATGQQLAHHADPFKDPSVSTIAIVARDAS